MVLVQAGVVSGGGGGDSSSATQLSGWDALGMLLQFTSLFFSAVARVLMKVSGPLFGPVALLSAQYVACGVPALIYSSTFTPGVWAAWGSVEWLGMDGVCFLGLTVGVFMAAATLQVMAVREMGPGGKCVSTRNECGRARPTNVCV